MHQAITVFLRATLLATVGCAGFRVPFTEYRAMDWRVESGHTAVNSKCTDMDQLNAVAAFLEEKHLKFIQSRDDSEAIVIDDLLASLGERCRPRFTKLSVPQIKNELFGDIQTIADSSKLRELGGVAFDYEDTGARTGIELTLHLRSHEQGPRRRMVAIFRLADNRVIHYNYSGTNNVDRETRRWPIDEFFSAVLGAGAKLVPN